MSLLRVHDLEYQLYRRAVHPELFVFRARREWEHLGHRIRVQLCDGGHVTEVMDSDGQLLTTVIGDRNLYLPETGREVSLPVRGQRHLTKTIKTGREVHSAYQIETLTPEDFEHFHQELWSDAQRSALFIERDGEPGRPETTLGYVDVLPLEDSFGVNTWHTIPADYAVLKTQTLIEM